MTTLIKRLFQFGFLLLLNANYCAAAEYKNLSQYIQDIKNRPSLTSNTLVFNNKPFIPVLNNAEDINPFSPSLGTQVSLASLRFVGVLKTDGKLWALITKPGGAAFSVHIGARVGDRYSHVLDINDERVLIEKKSRIGHVVLKKIIALKRGLLV